MSEVLENSYPDRIQDPEKARAMAVAGDAVRREAVKKREYASDIERENFERLERVVSMASDKDATALEIEEKAARIYDARKVLGTAQSLEEDIEINPKLADLRLRTLAEAQETLGQIDTCSAIGEQIELDAIENLLRAGDRTIAIQAMDIIENPRSEFFTRSYDGESHKQLHYRDLAIAAYQGGLIEEAQALETLVKYYKIPLLFAKAEVLEDAVPELLEEVGSMEVEDYKYMLKKLASAYISKGNLEPARAIVERLKDKRKFALLAEMVEAGDESSIPLARETAAQLRKELGAREIPDGYSAEEYRIRAFLRLYDAGDEGSLELALSVAKSAEHPWIRIKLLGWLGSEIQIRS